MSLATEGGLADKSEQLILAALRKAAAAPHGLPLFASRKTPGLFSGTAAARSAAERCQTAGWLERRPADGDGAREICVLSELGLTHLLGLSSPKSVLEELARTLAARQNELQALSETVRLWQIELEQF